MAEALSYSRPPMVERLADRLEKPLIDDRTYRVIKLPNELEALLIHDPQTDKASASMDVNVGSFSDPQEMPGTAHAVEHLLFMGTQKYPGENDYNTYLTRYGGYSNAFTSTTSTNYYFELSSTASSNSASSATAKDSSTESRPSKKGPLYGALDRFAQFFVQPLFSESTLDRELQAVDSENKKNLQSDVWRLQQLNRSLSSKKHPMHMFSTGNYKVLHDDPLARGVNIREEFIKFYQEHYSANRMKLAVLGRESLDELQSWVEEFFSGVQNNNYPKLRWDDIPAVGEAELTHQIFAKPVMEQRNLDLLFPYPEEEDHWESHPSQYISHLIGHEGPGSILAYVKAKGWADTLSAGSNGVCPGTNFFSVGLHLTEEGLKNYHEILTVIFQYIGMIKSQPPQEWVVEEMKKLAEVEFKFQQKIPASRTVSSLSMFMQQPLPREQLLSGQRLIRKFDPEAIKRGLDALRPDNFRLTLVSQKYPGSWDLREKWYGTEYRYEKIPEDLIKQLWTAVQSSPSKRSTELHMPAVNEFVPRRLDVEKKEVKEPARSPMIIRNDGSVRTWWKKDDRFWIPKANVNICLRNPLVGMTALMSVMTQIYLQLVDDSLNEYTYDAEIAGLQYALGRHQNGIDVSVSGYNDKMAVLTEKVLVTMRNLNVKDDRFKIVKERLARRLRNSEYSEPYRQISMHTRGLVNERGWTSAQLLDEVESVTAEDVRQFYRLVLSQMHIEVLVHGNMYKEDALRITEIAEKTLQAKRLPQSQWPIRRNLILPPGSDYRYERTLKNPDNVNHCIEYLLYVGVASDRPTRAKLLLLAQILDEPSFDTLRTKEQLGYVVSTSALEIFNAAAWRCLVQSEKDCAHLEKRIDAFLSGFEKTIEEISTEEFEEHKIGLINRRLERLKNLNTESARFWAHIDSEKYDFELSYRDAENLEALTKEDILAFYREHWLPSSPARAKASVWLVAQTSAAEKKNALVRAVSQFLEQNGVKVDGAALDKQFALLDLADGDTPGLVQAARSYLVDTAGVTSEKVDVILQQGQAAIDAVSSSMQAGSSSPQPNGGSTGDEATPKSKTVLIKDVKAFKASMPLSAGARAVTDLSAFEELGAKL